MGVFDVLPSASLDYLSAEDFRLLLNGTSNINVTTLMTYTTFNDESGKSINEEMGGRSYADGVFSLLSPGETTERINQFKKWFWSVLEKFNAVERQDLVSRCSNCGKHRYSVHSYQGLLLDGKSSIAGLGSGLSTSAISDDSSC